MRGRIVAVDSAPEYRDGAAGRLECAAMGLGIDSSRQAAHDDQPSRRQVAAEAARDLAAVGGARSRTHDRDGRPRQQLDLSLAPGKEPRRRVVDRTEEGRVGGIRAGEEAESERGEPRELGQRRTAP